MENKYLIPYFDGGNKIKINSSTLSDLSSCPRKTFYKTVMGFVAPPTQAMSFGTLIHKIMEHIYSISPAERKAINPELLVCKTAEDLRFDETDDLRTRKTAIKIIENYLKTFSSDNFRVYMLNDKPAIEVDFEFPLATVGDIGIVYCGRIDMIIQNVETKELMIMDHKTSRSIGKEFISRWNPNHQLTGYVMAASFLTGMPVRYALINGLQVAKTLQQVCRVTAERTTEDFDEFTETVCQQVENWMRS